MLSRSECMNGSIIDKAIAPHIVYVLRRLHVLNAIRVALVDNYADDLNSLLDKQEKDKAMNTLLSCCSKFGIEFLHAVLMYTIKEFFADFDLEIQKLFKTLILEFANEKGISQKEFKEELLAIKEISE